MLTEPSQSMNRTRPGRDWRRRLHSPRSSAFYVSAYLVAIIAANLLVARFGPGVAVLNAFLFIGLDLTARDHLHETWRGRGLAWKMGILIGAGSTLSWLLNRDAGQIALASFVAFACAGVADAVAYHLLGRPTEGLLDHYYWAEDFLRANSFNKTAVAVQARERAYLDLLHHGLVTVRNLAYAGQLDLCQVVFRARGRGTVCQQGQLPECLGKLLQIWANRCVYALHLYWQSDRFPERYGIGVHGRSRIQHRGSPRDVGGIDPAVTQLRDVRP